MIASTAFTSFIKPMMSPRNVSEQMWSNSNIPQTMIDKSANNNTVNIHYDSLINVEGDVNDADRITKQMEKVAKKISHNEVVDFVRDFSDGIRYGSSSNGKWG